jgi:hypothetical protein
VCIILQLYTVFVNTFFINIYIFVVFHLLLAYLCSILCMLFILYSFNSFFILYTYLFHNSTLFIISPKLFREFLSIFWDLLLIFLVIYVKLYLYCVVFLYVFPIYSTAKSNKHYILLYLSDTFGCFCCFSQKITINLDLLEVFLWTRKLSWLLMMPK